MKCKHCGQSISWYIYGDYRHNPDGNVVCESELTGTSTITLAFPDKDDDYDL